MNNGVIYTGEQVTIDNLTTENAPAFTHEELGTAMLFETCTNNPSGDTQNTNYMCHYSVAYNMGDGLMNFFKDGEGDNAGRLVFQEWIR